MTKTAVSMLALALLAGCAATPSAEDVPAETAGAPGPGGYAQSKASEKTGRQASRVGEKVEGRVDEETDEAVDGVLDRVLERVFN